MEISQNTPAGYIAAEMIEVLSVFIILKQSMISKSTGFGMADFASNPGGFVFLYPKCTLGLANFRVAIVGWQCWVLGEQ